MASLPHRDRTLLFSLQKHHSEKYGRNDGELVMISCPMRCDLDFCENE